MKSKNNNNTLSSGVKNEEKVNKKKIIGLVLIALIIITIVVVYIVYRTNETVRQYFDENILRKNISENNLNKILLEDYDKSHIFAYKDKILILKTNILEQYNTSAKKEQEITVEVSNPLSSTSGNYFMLAEKGSSKVYMIEDSRIKWEKDLEGNISKIKVNSAGYSAAILSGTAYKSVIVLFDEEGNELLRNYLANTIAIDVDITPDGEYLAFAEINTSGALVQSNVKIISIEKAKNKQTDAEYTFNAEAGKLILGIQYQRNNNLVCVYDDEIDTIQNNQNSKLLDFDTEKVTFESIELDNAITRIVEENDGIFDTQTIIKTVNTTNKRENTYKFNGITKELYTCRDKIAINLGTEVHFIDTRGLLIKKYSSSQEIRKIVISDKIAGIVYRDKIEIVKL